MFFNYVLQNWKLSTAYKVRQQYTQQQLCSIKSKAVPLHAIMVLGGERKYSSYSFLTSALDGGEWSASRLGRTLLRGKDPGTHCTGGWVGPRAGLDKEAIGKILCPCRGSNPDRPVVQSVVRHYILTELPGS
jgi:hypothetical protein